MIELLVKYIQDKGYAVNVHPGYLAISKQDYHLSWGITKRGMQLYSEEFLYDLADEAMGKIDKAIAEREAQGDAGMGKAPRMG